MTNKLHTNLYNIIFSNVESYVFALYVVISPSSVKNIVTRNNVGNSFPLC